MSRTTEVRDVTRRGTGELALWNGIGSGTSDVGECVSLHFIMPGDEELVLILPMEHAKALCEGMNKIMFALKSKEN